MGERTLEERLKTATTKAEWDALDADIEKETVRLRKLNVVCLMINLICMVVALSVALVSKIS